MVKRLSRILDMDESAVQLCAELPFFGSVVKRLSHILHMDGSTVQLCPELPILTFFSQYTKYIYFFIYSKKYMFYEQKNSLHTEMKAVLIFLLRL